MSLGPPGASLDPEQAENFEDVSPFVECYQIQLIISQMEKQFAVKGQPPSMRVTSNTILSTEYTSAQLCDI